MNLLAAVAVVVVLAVAAAAVEVAASHPLLWLAGLLAGVAAVGIVGRPLWRS